MSVSNLLVPNNLDLECANLTATDTVTATTFNGSFVPIGPQDIGSLNDSSSDVYTPGSAALNVAGGASIAKRLNVNNIWVDSANNAAITPDVNAHLLIINDAADGTNGMSFNNTNAGQDNINYDENGALVGAIQYIHSPAANTDIMFIGANQDSTGQSIILNGFGVGSGSVIIDPQLSTDKIVSNANPNIEVVSPTTFDSAIRINPQGSNEINFDGHWTLDLPNTLQDLAFNETVHGDLNVLRLNSFASGGPSVSINTNMVGRDLIVNSTCLVGDKIEIPFAHAIDDIGLKFYPINPVEIHVPQGLSNQGYHFYDTGIADAYIKLGADKRVTLPATGTTTVTTAQSGTKFSFVQATADTTINMPNPFAGGYYEFWNSAAADGAHTQTIHFSAGFVNGSNLSNIVSTTTLANVSTKQNIILSATAVNTAKGDYVKLNSDGTNWYVEAVSTGTASAWTYT